MEKVKVLKDNADEKQTVTWNGESFGITQENKPQKVTKVIILNPREMLELVKFAGNLADKGGGNNMSEKTTIEPQDILDFVGDLGVHAYSELWVQAGKDPHKKLGGKDKKELQIIADIVSKSIAKGLILANHQPELAGALVGQMNEERPGYADKLLDDMLFQYMASLSHNLAERARIHWERK